MQPCRFPAAELIRMRRQLAAQADRSNDVVFVRNAMEFVRATDDLRIAHFELEDCLCWQEAVERLDVQAPRFEVSPWQ